MSKFVESKAAASPASEYYDPMNATHGESGEHPHISIHEPTPDYERHPPFPQPILENPKDGYMADTTYPSDANGAGTVRSGSIFHRKTPSTASGPGSAAGSLRRPNADNSRPRTPLDGVSPTRSSHVSIDSDTVLAPNAQASVKRGGTWAHGPGTSGHDQGANLRRGRSLAERATVASQHMNEKERMALSKAEIKDAKRLSKIIKAEGKVEDKALKAGLKELDSLQRAQKKASAKETEAVTTHSRAAKEEHRASAAYLEAKTRWERAQVNLKVTEERMDLARRQAEKTTQMVRRQAEEVEALRERKATDDRERAVKLADLKAGMTSPTGH